MTAQAQLSSFIAKFTPPIAALGKAALAKMRERFPNANRMVYDNYNALAVGFVPSERPSEAIFSIAIWPRAVSLFFLQGAPSLPDPKKLLLGSGNIVRHIRLESAADLDKPAIKALMAHALKRAKVPFEPGMRGRLIIKSISAKQRPRRP